MPHLKRRLPAALLLAAGLAGCSSSPSGGTTTPTASQNVAYVRFVDVAPDAGVASPSDPAVEIPLFQTANANVRIDGTLIGSVPGDSLLRASASGAPPSLVSMTAYLPVAAGSHAILFEDPSAYTAQGYLGVSGSTAQLLPNARYTVVLSGSYCLNTLQFTTFTDDAPANAGLVVYAAAPSSAQSSYDVGVMAAGSSGGPFTKLGSVPRNTRAAFALPQGASIGAYAAIVGTPQTILPSALDAYDQNNVVPFNALTALALFVRDGIPFSQNGGSCPKTPGLPTIQGALTN